MTQLKANTSATTPAIMASDELEATGGTGTRDGNWEGGAVVRSRGCPGKVEGWRSSRPARTDPDEVYFGRDGTQLFQSHPTTDVLDGVQALAVGRYHTCALMTTGGVRCWGAKGIGRLHDRSGMD